MIGETDCPARGDKQHCQHWYDGEACCACDDPPMSNEVRVAQGMPGSPSTEDIIRPIITSTYGDNGMSRAAIINLAEKIDSFRVDLCVDDRSREDMIMLTLWDWFPGGSTAKVTAQKIEAALEVDRGTT